MDDTNQPTMDDTNKHPLLALHAAQSVARKQYDPIIIQPDDPHLAAIVVFFDGLLDAPNCYDYNRCRNVRCHCLHELSPRLTDEEKSNIARKLYCFACKSHPQQTETVGDWIAYSGALSIEKSANVQDGALERKMVFLLPGTSYQICKHALTRLIGFGRRRWEKASTVQAPTTTIHGASGKRSNNHSDVADGLLNEFFTELEAASEPRATKVVRSVVEGNVGTEYSQAFRKTMENL
jgi:hypothetical protein